METLTYLTGFAFFLGICLGVIPNEKIEDYLIPIFLMSIVWPVSITVLIGMKIGKVIK